MKSFRRRSLKLLTAGVLLAGLMPLAAMAQNKLKVAGLYAVPIEQQWASRIHKALTAARDRGEIEYQFSDSVANADAERVLRQYAQAGSDLIVGEVFGVESAARKVAREYPKVAFLMGSSGKPQQPNFSVFDSYNQEAAYLTGMIAGGMTKTNTIGMVGGFPIPLVNRLMHAFMAGAREVNPNAQFQVTFIGSWFDPAKAKEAAFAQMDRGADILFAERFGVSDAAKERGKLAIGNVINTQPQYPNTVVASGLWHMEPTIERALAAVKSKQFKAEDYGQYSYMKYKGTELAPLGTFEGKVPAKIMEKVRATENDIISGKYVVKTVATEPKSTK